MIDGMVVSITEICCESEAELPEESVAVQVTIVSPSGNTSGASLVTEIFQPDQMLLRIQIQQERFQNKLQKMA